MTIEESDVDPADLVAELDDAPELDLAAVEDDSELYSGTARGGLWNGRAVESRCPKGFLLIDREHGWVWVYDRGDDGTFTVRSDEPAPLDDDGRWRAAEEGNYDIMVPAMAGGGDES